MKIAIGTDHHGYELGQEIIKILEKKGISYMYAGARSAQDTEYNNKIVEYTTTDVLDEKILGIIITSTGIGANITANKVEGINACLCNNFHQVKWGREEHNMNVLCLSAFEEEYLEVQNIINTYINSEYK